MACQITSHKCVHTTMFTDEENTPWNLLSSSQRSCSCTRESLSLMLGCSSNLTDEARDAKRSGTSPIQGVNRFTQFSWEQHHIVFRLDPRHLGHAQLWPRLGALGQEEQQYSFQIVHPCKIDVCITSSGTMLLLVNIIVTCSVLWQNFTNISRIYQCINV